MRYQRIRYQSIVVGVLAYRYCSINVRFYLRIIKTCFEHGDIKQTLFSNLFFQRQSRRYVTQITCQFKKRVFKKATLQRRTIVGFLIA